MNGITPAVLNVIQLLDGDHKIVILSIRFFQQVLKSLEWTIRTFQKINDLLCARFSQHRYFGAITRHYGSPRIEKFYFRQ